MSHLSQVDGEFARSATTRRGVFPSWAVAWGETVNVRGGCGSFAAVGVPSSGGCWPSAAGARVVREGTVEVQVAGHGGAALPPSRKASISGAQAPASPHGSGRPARLADPAGLADPTRRPGPPRLAPPHRARFREVPRRPRRLIHRPGLPAGGTRRPTTIPPTAAEAPGTRLPSTGTRLPPPGARTTRARGRTGDSCGPVAGRAQCGATAVQNGSAPPCHALTGRLWRRHLPRAGRPVGPPPPEVLS